MRKMMFVFAIILVLLIANTNTIFCQEELLYYANKNDILYEDFNSIYTFEEKGRIRRGERILKIYGEVRFVSVENIRIKRVSVQSENNYGWLYTDSISIANSVLLANEIIDNEWTNSYYLDVLRKRNRDELFLYEPFWRDHFVKYERDFGDENIADEWYEIAHIPLFEFGNIYAILSFFPGNRYNVIFENISKNNGKYSFYAVCTFKRLIFDEIDLSKKMPLNTRFYMELYLDGDYLDVFIDGEKQFSLIKINEELKKQFDSLMKNQAIDLSYIHWPRRAPKQLNAGEETRVLENLRLRESPNTEASIITTMEQGSKVTILEIGPNAVIDGITAPWVKVQTTDGKVGWCYGLYLRETRLEPRPNDLSVSAGHGQEEPLSDKFLLENYQRTTKDSQFPLWLFIGGGLVLAVGVGVIIVVKRSKG